LRDWDTLPLSGLAADDAIELLNGSGQRGVVESVAHVLVDRTGGNPLALVELASSLSDAQRSGLDPLPDPLPLGPKGAVSFGAVLRVLPEATRLALGATAAAGPRAGQLLAGALESLGVEVGDLGPAETSHIITVQGPLVEFRHPLLRSAALETLSAPVRRRVHAALAQTCRNVDPARFAWHLEQSTVGASEWVASAWERAAEVGRAAPVAAADALQHAALTSPLGPKRPTRLLRAAQASHTAGRTAASHRFLADIHAADASTYVEAVLLRGTIAIWAGRDDAVRDQLLHLVEGSADVTGEQAIRALLCLLLSSQNLGDLRACEAYASRAAALAQRLGGGWPATVEPLCAQVALLRGDRMRFWELTEVPQLPDDLLDEHISPLAMIAQCLCWAERLPQARDSAEKILRLARQRAAVSLLPYPLSCVGEVAWRLGDWQLALAVLDEAADLTEQADQLALRGFTLALRARVTAGMGQEKQTRQDITTALAIGRKLTLTPIEMYAGHALGLLELSVGRIHHAVAALERVDVLRRQMGQGEFNVVPFAADLGEAWILTGRDHDADKLAEQLSDHAAEQRSPWAHASALRLRAMLGRDNYEELLTSALDALPADRSPFDRARTCLILADRLRRDRRQRDARRPLTEAINLFTRLGATPWQHRAEGLLGAVGAVVRGRRVAGTLTGQELQVCRAVAQGNSNREVAAALCLSPKTVEQHLTKAYIKLGVRNRSQLVRLAAGGGLDAIQPVSHRFENSSIED
jgi:DNA-binding CsgD family transcriptional regulator